VAVIMVVFVVAGGSNTGTPAIKSASDRPSPVGAGYLASGSNWAMFIQWNVNGSHLSGSAQYDKLKGTAPNESLTNSTIPVTGEVKGSKISLSFEDAPSVFGTYSGGNFAINIPQSDGSLAAATFRSATPSQFNEAVAAMQSQRGAANQAATARQELERNEAAVTKAVGNVDGDLSQLQRDAGGLATDLHALAGGVASMKTAVAGVASAEAHVQSEAGSSTGTSVDTCGDAEDVGGDAQDVAGDAEDVSGDGQEFENDIKSVRSDVTTLTTAVSAMKSDVAAVPSFNADPPGQSTITQAIASANRAVQAAIGQANAYIGQANQYVMQAYEDSAAAYRAGSCGTAPSPPTPQPDLS
jgi:hypothetical protein